MNLLNRVSLPALRAVDAVARLGSLRAAAEDLGVTPGAVSQQIILAERQLGQALFIRQSSGMILNKKGQNIALRLRDGFENLTSAVALAERKDNNVLTVSVPPVFGARWLIWRLPKFQAANPGVRVRLDADTALLNPTLGEADLCLRTGQGGWPGVSAERLMPVVVFPVCAPALAERIQSHSDLAKLPIIRDSHSQIDWEDWLAPEGYRDLALGCGPEYSDAMLCIDAAMTGAGVFLSFEIAAADALLHGRVVEPFKRRHPSKHHYWLITPRDGQPSRVARSFMRWLKAEIQDAGIGKTGFSGQGGQAH